MKHLITGGGGFLGRHLIEALRAVNPADTIVSVGLKGPEIKSVPHRDCDLLKAKELQALLSQEKPDQVYHLAGSARVSEQIGMPEYFRSNFLTTQTLLEALDQAPPARLFFSSSIHVYGNQEGLVSEDSTPYPDSHYGMSKYLAERAMEEFAKRHPSARVLIGRLYSCIGPGQGEGFVVADLTRKLQRLTTRGILETGPLSAYRRFLDVRDAALLIAKLTQQTESNYSSVNIASPCEMQVAKLVELLVEISGKQAQIQAKASDGNPFRGLQVSLERLQRLAPDFNYRPLKATLNDVWKAASTAQVEISQGKR